MDEITTDLCLRCGYNLVGIANDRACPECGLLAERSRRVSDELHQTRPRWLRRLSRGVWLILLAIVLPVPLSLAAFVAQIRYDQTFLFTSPSISWMDSVIPHLRILALDIPLAIFSLGALLLATREGYPPADGADLRLRRGVRLALLAPWTALILLHVDCYVVFLRISQGNFYSTAPASNPIELAALVLLTLGCIPLPLLLAVRLRGLARRARTAHLAEHCMIVGFGVASTLAYVFLTTIAFTHSESWGWGDFWTTHGIAPLIIATILGTLCFLFVLWALYLMTRFAIAFAVAARNLRRQWRQDDRSLLPS